MLPRQSLNGIFGREQTRGTRGETTEQPARYLDRQVEGDEEGQLFESVKCDRLETGTSPMLSTPAPPGWSAISPPKIQRDPSEARPGQTSRQGCNLGKKEERILETQIQKRN